MSRDLSIPESNAAAGSGLAVDPAVMAGMSSFQIESRLHYVWTPEDIRVSDRNIGHQILHRGRFHLLRNIHYLDQDQSAERYDNDDDMGSEEKSKLIRQTKTAWASATELVGAYAIESFDKGLRVVEAVTGLEPNYVAQIELAIMPTIPSTMLEMLEIVGGLQADQIPGEESPASFAETAKDRIARLPRTPLELMNDNGEMVKTDLRAVAEKSRDRIEEALLAAINHARTHVEYALAETIERSKPNGHGKAALASGDRWYAKQVGENVSNEPPKAEPVQVTVNQAPADTANLAAVVAATVAQTLKDMGLTPSVEKRGPGRPPKDREAE